MHDSSDLDGSNPNTLQHANAETKSGMFTQSNTALKHQEWTHKPLPRAITWKSLENVMVSERSQIENSTYCVSPFIWIPGRRQNSSRVKASKNQWFSIFTPVVLSRVYPFLKAHQNCMSIIRKLYINKTDILKEQNNKAEGGGIWRVLKGGAGTVFSPRRTEGWLS